MGKIAWVGVGCIALILVVGGWNVLAANILHGEVTPRKLFVSVTNVSRGGDPFGDESHDVCHQVSAQGWTCEVADPRGSGGSVLYLVKMDGDSSCWDARGTYRG